MIEMTIKFAKELDREVAQFFVFTPPLDPKLWSRGEDKLVRREPEFFDLARAYMELYLRPGRILREILDVFRTGGVRELGQIWRFLMARAALVYNVPIYTCVV